MKRTDFLKTCAVGACGCGVLGLLSRPGSGRTPCRRADGGRSGRNSPTEIPAGRRPRALRTAFRRPGGGARRSRPRPGPAEARRSLLPEARSAPREVQGRSQGLPGPRPDRLAGAGRTRREGGDPARHRQARPLRLPLVKPGRTPASFCRCTLGWQEAVFSTLTGKPVTAEIVETVLGGGSRCSFLIRFL